jgi:lactate permease
VLFAPLQQTVANAEGLSETSIIAAQGTGGAIGNAISPANVVLGTGTAGIIGCEGAIVKRTIVWTFGVAGIVGGLTLLLNTLTLFRGAA